MSIGNPMTPAIKGTAALAELLDCIGGMAPNGDMLTDHDTAKVLVENELALRALLAWSLEKFCEAT